jgi:hypothetical protein
MVETPPSAERDWLIWPMEETPLLAQEFQKFKSSRGRKVPWKTGHIHTMAEDLIQCLGERRKRLLLSGAVVVKSVFVFECLDVDDPPDFINVTKNDVISNQLWLRARRVSLATA